MARILSRISRCVELFDARKPLAKLIPIVFAVVVIWQGAPAVVEGYKFRPADDFYFLLRAGSVVRDAPSSLYAENVDSRKWREEYRYPFPSWYPYPAGVAYLTAPLTFFSDDAALLAMRFAIALSTLYLASLVARTFESIYWRGAIVAAMVCWEPILLNAKIGQTGAFVALLLAVAANAYIRDRLLGAALFGILALKPSAALGPGLAVLMGPWRAWLCFAGVAVAVVLIPFAIPGPGAFEGWLRVLYDRSAIDLGGGNTYNQGLSSLISFRGAVGVSALVGFGAVVALVALRVRSRLGIEAATAFSILTGFLINPHSLLYDWGIAFVALMLLRRSPLVRGPFADSAFGVLAISLFVAGQWAWRASFESPIVNPLTVWSVAVDLVLVALSFRLRLPSPQVVAPEPALSA